MNYDDTGSQPQKNLFYFSEENSLVFKLEATYSTNTWKL
jgi:hypothetical protein